MRVWIDSLDAEDVRFDILEVGYWPCLNRHIAINIDIDIDIDIGISIDTGMCRGCGGGVGAHGCFLLSESKSWLFAQHNLPNTLL